MLRNYLPFLKWPRLSGATVRADFVAGITVALVLIPQSMAYAQLAGMPPYYGLYAAFLPGVIAALFGSSKQLATGPVAVVSLLTASALIPFATAGSDAFIALAILLTFLVGAFQLLLGLLRLEALVSFLSHPVVVGFTNAAALIIVFSQLSIIFGFPMAHGDYSILGIWNAILKINHLHLPTFIFAVSAFIILFLLKKYQPTLPSVLIAVSATILASWLLDFQGMGGQVVGKIPAGLPPFTLPTLNLTAMGQLFVSAVVIAVVGFMETLSIAKAMAARTKDQIDSNQSLIGQGLANLVGCVGQSYPTCGSVSRSMVNLGAGAKSGLSALFTAGVVLATLLFLTPLFFHLPQSVLAAVILMTAMSLVNFGTFRQAWHANQHDGIVAGVTFVATLAFAPHLDWGILFGIGLAMFLSLSRSMRPRVAILGRYGDGTLRDVGVHPELSTDKRITLVRFDGQLFFANVTYFEEAVLAAVAAKPNATFLLVVGDGINQLDATGEEVVNNLAERLATNGVTVVFSGLKAQVLAVMRRTGLFERLGGETNIFATASQALREIYQRLEDGEHRPLLPS